MSWFAFDLGGITDDRNPLVDNSYILRREWSVTGPET